MLFKYWLHKEGTNLYCPVLDDDTVMVDVGMLDKVPDGEICAGSFREVEGEIIYDVSNEYLAAVGAMGQRLR